MKKKPRGCHALKFLNLNAKYLNVYSKYNNNK